MGGGGLLTMCPLSRYRLNRGLAEFDALFIVPVMQVQLEQVETFTNTERGSGGFGHSGRH